MNNERKIFIKNFIYNTIGTGINSFNSLFFLIIVTRINGIETAGIFSIAFATSCILYTLALYSGRICQVTDIENKIKDKDYIVNRVLTCFFMIICTIVFLLIKQYSAFKTSVFILLAIFKAIEAFSDIIYGIMQKNGLLYKAGKSLTMKGVIGIISFLLVDIFTKDLLLACLSLVIVNIIILIIYDYLLIGRKIINKENKLSIQNVIFIFKSEFFVFANSFMAIYIINAPKYAIDSFLTEDIQAIYGYIMMPATVMMLFTQFVVIPVLGKLKELYEKQDFKVFNNIMLKIKLTVVAFGLFAVGLAYAIGPEFLGLIYGVELLQYRMNLCIIIGSYIFYAISYINLVILTTMRHTFVQFIIYIISMIIAFIGANILVKIWGINGAVLSCVITLVMQFLIYSFATNIIMYKKKEN